MSQASAIAGERDVQALALNGSVLRHAGKPRFQLLKRGLDFSFDLIGGLTERRAFGGGDIANVLELCG
jgi:hypothetical protein